MPRTKGALGLKKKALLEQIEKKSRGYWHPVVFLAEVAQDTEVELAIRVDCAKACAQYVAPRIKPVDLEHSTEKSKQYMVRWEDSLNNGKQIIDAPQTTPQPIEEKPTTEEPRQTTRREIRRMSVEDRQTNAGINVEEGTSSDSDTPKPRKYRHVHLPIGENAV